MGAQCSLLSWNLHVEPLLKAWKECLSFTTELSDRERRKSVSTCCVLSTCYRLPHIFPSLSSLRVSGVVWGGLSVHFADVETEGQGSQIAYGMSCTCDPCRTRAHAVVRARLLAVSACLIPSSPLSRREPAAPWEQLHQRVQHSRQLHVRQRAVHPRRLAV